MELNSGSPNRNADSFPDQLPVMWLNKLRKSLIRDEFGKTSFPLMETGRSYQFQFRAATTSRRMPTALLLSPVISSCLG